jgi:hypothetical protein
MPHELVLVAVTPLNTAETAPVTQVTVSVPVAADDDVLAPPADVAIPVWETCPRTRLEMLSGRAYPGESARGRQADGAPVLRGIGDQVAQVSDSL